MIGGACNLGGRADHEVGSDRASAQPMRIAISTFARSCVLTDASRAPTRQARSL